MPTEQDQLDAINGTLADEAKKLQIVFDQNGLITEGFRRMRQGKFAGADGLDAVIVALQGGSPLTFTPAYP